MGGVAGRGCSLEGVGVVGGGSEVMVFDKYRSEGVTGGDIKTHTVTLRYRTLV